MKYSQQIGIIAALCLIGSCFLPWVEIISMHKILNGINGYVNEQFTFGTQIKAHSFFCIISIILFLLNKIWAKRTNIFVCFLSFTWAIKNFILFRMCRMGDCPETKFGLWLLMFFAITMFIMSLLPKIEIQKK
ncbi:MAG: hypothetical protein NTZ59_10035 [Bacteroidetes bacterium]|nr:hypothetical protein [Bacteroidota bacterium]